MKSTVRKTLREVFGFENFRKGQEQVIEAVLEGRSALAVFPTGSGKSLCYQLPGSLLPGLTLVVSPLLALMKDQVDFLRRQGVAAARLDSTLSLEETREVYAQAREGRVKLLYVAPERVFNERFLASMAGVPIDLVVVDEAHCISEWGHNFRPEYLKLAVATKYLEASRALALTATATPQVVEDICREFSISSSDYVNTGFYRPNLALSISPTEEVSRTGALVERLRERPRGATVVYVTLQKTSEEVAGALQEAGFAAKAYHAGLKNEAREETQNWFMASSDSIVVATIAFGMGIDKSDIRYVYHYNLPKSLENYSQEIGRAGRDGAPSICEVLGSVEDVVVLENFVFGDTPDGASVGNLLSYLLDQDEVFDVSIYELANRFDIRILVVRTLLTYLELDGVLRFIAPFYAEYRYRFLQPKESWMGRFDESRQAFLEAVFACSEKKAKWSRIDLGAAARSLGEDRQRLVKAFQYLEEKGRLEVQASNVRMSYRLLDRRDLPGLEEKLVERTRRNEAKNIERLERMVQMLETKACRTRQLLAYFGEELGEDCGHCDYCSTGEMASLTAAGSACDAGKLAEAISCEVIQGLDTNRKRARFLCGISSPALVRARLTKDPNFGSCAEIPFKVVLEALEGSG